MQRFAHRAAVLVLAALLMVVLAACGGSSGDDSGASPDAPARDTASTDTPPAEEPVAETEVAGMPAEFPADVPVHPGTVTEYKPIEVTESTTVHQLYVESRASFDDVIAWYQNSLPEGWSVGFFESEDNQGMEAKIALNGGAYTPADPQGVGGGVLVGVFEIDGGTQIVTTVTVMGQP